MMPARKLGNRQRKSGNTADHHEPALKMQKMTSTSGDFVVTSSYSDETCPVEKENIPEQESKTPIEIKASETEKKATIESVLAAEEALPKPVQNPSASSFCKEILQELLEYILPE